MSENPTPTAAEIEEMVPGLGSDGPLVGILMGSESDRPVMEKACAELEARALSYELRVISAHRNPKEVAAYAEGAALRGIRVLICGAGMAAALPGVVAAYTELPVIGVGGISTVDDAKRMVDAGASLIQLYTGFIYGGPPLVRAINRALAR